ncbi:MAG: hypothetical protein QW837_08400 [Conexivisphaerales archaeon]
MIYTGMRATLTMEDTDQGRAATLTRSGTYAIPRVCSMIREEDRGKVVSYLRKRGATVVL